MKQPDKLTAYYFRAALQTDTLYLDIKCKDFFTTQVKTGLPPLLYMRIMAITD